MSYTSFRISVFLIATSAILCLQNLQAEDATEAESPPIEPAPQKDSEKPQRPADLTLDEFLQGWIQKAALIERLDADYRRIAYDRTFNRVKYGEGKLSADWMGHGFYTLAPCKSITDQTMKRGSVVYKVIPSSSERWYWTSTAIIKFDDATRVFERIEIPLADQQNPDRPRAPELPETKRPTKKARSDLGTWVWFNFEFFYEPFYARPFLIGMPLDEMQTRFTISLVKQSESEIRLKFVPMVASLKSNYSQVELILAPRTYEPRAMRIVSPTGDSDDVYTFNKVQINRTEREPDPDLWRLDFKGYRKRVSYHERH